MKSAEEKKVFSLVKRARSFTHAFRGIRIFLATTHNAWVQIVLAVAIFIFGVYFSISATEWIFLVIVIGALFSAEAFNTAIEIDIDLTSPEYHPYARDTKDVAAGAVLITAPMALAVFFVIFVSQGLTFI